jgi:hypothetical protein
MEMSQGNSLCSYLKQKCHFFKQNQTTGRRAGPAWEGGSWYQWERGGGGESVWDGEYSASTTHVHKWKKWNLLKLLQEFILKYFIIYAQQLNYVYNSGTMKTKGLRKMISRALPEFILQTHLINMSKDRSIFMKAP